MQKIIILIFLFPIALFSQECKTYDSLINYFFINGIGNTTRSIDDSVISLKNKLGLSQGITKLTNPKNDAPPNDTSDSPTWEEFKETFSQIRQESDVKNKDFVDKKTIESFYSLLDNNKYNIIISHSQGNLFANDLCRFNAGRKKQINLGIAVPASSIGCGNKYVTLYNDIVISGLRTATSTVRPYYPEPLPYNEKLDLTSRCVDKKCHALIEVYLTFAQPLEKIKSIINLTIDEIVLKELNFPLAEMTLRQVKQEDKNALISSYESLSEIKDSATLTLRRSVASVKAFSYLSDVANSSLISSLMKLNFNNVNKKEFKKLLDIEIKADSEKEFSDVVAYFMESLKELCPNHSSIMPANIMNYCKISKKFHYFDTASYEDSKNFKEYTLANVFMKWDNSVKTLQLNCKDIQDVTASKSYPVELSYVPEYSKISSISVNDLTFDVYPKNLLNKSAVEKENVLNVDITLSEKGIYSYKLNALKSKINFVKSDSEKYKECNSITKLLNKKDCNEYLMTILSHGQ